jgi:hypothetical protein
MWWCRARANRRRSCASSSSEEATSGFSPRGSSRAAFDVSGAEVAASSALLAERALLECASSCPVLDIVSLGVEVATHSKPMNTDVMKHATMTKYARRAIFLKSGRRELHAFQRSSPLLVPGGLHYNSGVAINHRERPADARSASCERLVLSLKQRSLVRVFLAGGEEG